MRPTLDDDTERYPLDPALDFIRHVAELNRALERLSSRMDRTLGVTAQQRLVLRCIGKYPGITAGQLAYVLHLDAGTISASLRRLEHRRLVERRHDPRDRRRVVLGLTGKGRELDRPTVGTVENVVEQLLEKTSDSAIVTTKSMMKELSILLSRASEPADGHDIASVVRRPTNRRRP